MPGFSVVFVTCSGPAEAEKIADALVAAKAAACVNILKGLRSVYRWEGRVEKSDEALLVVKSESDRFGDIEAIVKQNHSYSCPEIIALPIEKGAASYLDWIRESTRTTA